ncbi:hypothetical protein SD71_03845 [Cohnella kolymensis]|uniref:Uncharacterized protein n=1 Tax=Cohnella kolymensis TaxID=1590652 RepID=A0ABR5A7W6_9BACL|nr:hypothetical protein [Cohnella kolymensis]KIL37108.1 hypothetical protein SD71_03845 [Cohnella kolymensis]
MRRTGVLFIVFSFIIGLLGTAVYAAVPSKGVELECCSIIELVSNNGQIGAIRVSNDDNNLSVETYLWSDTMKILNYNVAVANVPSELPNSPGDTPKPGLYSISRTVTSDFTRQIDSFSYSNLNPDLIALAVFAKVQDENGQLITVWGRGVPMTDKNWPEYFEYSKRAGCPAIEVPPKTPTSPRTIGYWKTHAGFNGNNEDVVTQYLPITLGNVTVNTAAFAVEVLTFKSFEGGSSNGYNKLAAQLLAVKLNAINGADIAPIASTIIAADAALSSVNVSPWSVLTKAERSNILYLMSTLDEYNNSEF